MPTPVGKWSSQEQTKLEELRLTLLGEIAAQAELSTDVPLLQQDQWVEVLQLFVPKFGEFMLFGRILISTGMPAQTVHFLSRMKINGAVVANVQVSQRGPIGGGRVAESMAFAVPFFHLEDTPPLLVTLEALSSSNDAIVHKDTPYIPSGTTTTRMLAMLIEKWPLGGM